MQFLVRQWLAVSVGTLDDEQSKHERDPGERRRATARDPVRDPDPSDEQENVACTYRPMPPTVPSFQDHFIALLARPCPGHEIESLERDRLPAALAPPVLFRPLVKPLERGVDLGKLRRLARRVHDIQLLVRGVRPPVSRLLLERVAGCATVARERVRHACSLLEQASLQVLPLCRRQHHTASRWEIAARRASRKHLRLASLALPPHPRRNSVSGGWVLASPAPRRAGRARMASAPGQTPQAVYIAWYLVAAPCEAAR